MNYYNGRIECWEPAIEKVSLSLSSRHQETTNASTELYIQRPVRINLTEELVYALDFLFAKEKESDEASGGTKNHHGLKATSLATKRYKIVNMTSRRLVIR